LAIGSFSTAAELSVALDRFSLGWVGREPSKRLFSGLSFVGRSRNRSARRLRRGRGEAKS
jgi:hypothetical protein